MQYARTGGGPNTGAGAGERRPPTIITEEAPAAPCGWPVGEGEGERVWAAAASPCTPHRHTTPRTSGRESVVHLIGMTYWRRFFHY